MIEKQEFIFIDSGELLDRVEKYKKDGFRLVQIGATKSEVFELNYSFDKEYKFVNLRVCLPLEQPALKSISSVFWNAFLYENEIHDLFGITITGISVDYGGNFYRMSVKAPFGEVK